MSKAWLSFFVNPNPLDRQSLPVSHGFGVNSPMRFPDEANES